MADPVVPPQPVQPVINDDNNDGDGNIQIYHAQAVQGADGHINLKVEQTKLPEFWGQKKDSIMPNTFIQRGDNMTATNGWSDHIAFRSLLWFSGVQKKFGSNLRRRWRTSLVIIGLGRLFDRCSRSNLRSSLMTSSSWMVWLTWQ